MKQLTKLANRVASDPQSDRDLLASFVATRDSDSLTALFRRHAGAIHAVARDICPAAADDVVQSALVLLARRAPGLTDRESVAGWLFVVSRRLAQKARTAAARRNRHETTSPPSASPANPLDDLSHREVRALVAEELAKLPEHLRVPLVLHYWEGATHAEAAARLGCSVSTLKRRENEARDRLGARLTRRGLTGSGILTALTSLHAQAMTPLALPAGVLHASGATAALGRTLAIGAFVLAAGVGLAFGLGSGPDSESPATPTTEGREPPTAPPKTANEVSVRDVLPSGAIARLSSGAFYHGGIIARVFVSPDGHYAVSVGSDALMSVPNVKTKRWDLETGLELPLAKGKLADLPGGGAVAAVVSLKSSLALVVIPRKPLTPNVAGPWLIDAETGETLAEITGKADFNVLAVHPNGKAVAAPTVRAPDDTGLNVGVDILDLERKNPPIRVLPPQKLLINQLRFSPDGRYLAVQYSDGVRDDIVDVQTGKIVLSVPGSDTNEGPYDSFAFSPDGKLFAKETRGLKTLRVWSLADGRLRSTIACEGSWGHTLAFDSTSMRLGRHSGPEFRLYDLATGKTIWEAMRKPGYFGGAAFTPDGTRLITTENEDLIVRDAKTGKVITTAVHRADIAHLAWSRDGKRVITWDGATGTPGRMWNAANGRQETTIAGHLGCTGLVTSPDGTLLATSVSQVWGVAGDPAVRLLTSTDGREVATFRPKLARPDPGVSHLCFAPDGKTLLGAAREIIFQWDVATKSELRTFSHPFTLVHSVDPLAEGDRAIISGWLPRADGNPVNITNDSLQVLTFDLKTGKEVGERITFGRDVLRGVSSDGRFVVRSSYGGPSGHHAEVQHLASGRTLWQLPRPDGRAEPWVVKSAFSPDRRTLSVGYSDGTVRVFEWATRNERLRFAHGAIIRELAYSPDGTRLASAGSRWGLVWDLTSPQVAKPTSGAEAWTALAGSESKAGLAAVRYWVDRPADAVGYFKERVRPFAAPDAKAVTAWIEQLASQDFAEREAAEKNLTTIGEAVAERLAKAAAKTDSPEVRARLGRILAALDDQRPWTGELLRTNRAVEVLEAIRTPAAREVLKSLASGAPEARVTRAASAALKRLDGLR